ncbi:hypothetical protein FEM48_ZijujUnG0028500 [Ziziphus jujuba var. spinosa]|nr:hypothetical protein FEM48_ZijujUnG0028500 [Ziziphus jujuba var. spinosa]
MVNDGGYTPLHHTASVGNKRMCECLAEADPSLLGIRNKNKETPLFIAALHGKMDAFLCLHSVIIRSSSSSDHDYTRRLTAGNTVLHVAIAFEYFDFAFQIIHLYKNLCDSMNEQGLTPLHILATKSSAFASGTYLRLCKRLLYQCLLFSSANNSELRDIFIEEEETTRTDIENPTGKCHIG